MQAASRVEASSFDEAACIGRAGRPDSSDIRRTTGAPAIAPPAASIIWRWPPIACSTPNRPAGIETDHGARHQFGQDATNAESGRSL
jgi:hypothetical protein